MGMMMSGVKIDFPDADEEEAVRILRHRLENFRELEDRGLFIPAAAS
jgi:hypothetical protein